MIHTDARRRASQAGSGSSSPTNRGVTQSAPQPPAPITMGLHSMGASALTTATRDLIAEINELRTQRHAAILAHNYQRPEIQDIADVVADSLAMARRATELDAPILVICGVHFMAETAAIANPDKRILIPDPTAGCSLASTIQAADVRAWRATHPEGLVVAYINTAAGVKAEADYCCTSGNAVAVIESLPPDVPVLFLPDLYLGNYLRKVTGRPLDVWLGECHVHAGL